MNKPVRGGSGAIASRSWGGVAIGYATLGTIGFEGRLDYAAIGGVTNHAAALCARADPGQILASQRVLSAVREIVQVEKVGDASEEALTAPKAYRVLGLRTQATA